MRPLRALFLESTKNALKMCPFRALSLEFTKSAHKFALFQHHIPCPQKMLDARLVWVSVNLSSDLNRTWCNFVCVCVCVGICLFICVFIPVT